MAQPSAHYKALQNDLELLRKRELSNQKRIASLEDKLTMLTELVMESLGQMKPVKAEKPKEAKKEKASARRAYELLTDSVRESEPDAITAWDLKIEYGFASGGTVSSILDREMAGEYHSGEFEGEEVGAQFYDGRKARKLIESVISSAKVAIEYDESGRFKSSSLQSNKAAKRPGSPGKFAVPSKSPKECITSIAEGEMLRELRSQQTASTFIESFTSTYGRALGMDDFECANLLRELVSSGKVTRNADIVKTVSS